MTYIAFKNYVGKTINCEDIDIPYGAAIDVDGDYLQFNGLNICRIDSMVGHMHFAINDDDNGLERGTITFQLAYQHCFSKDDFAVINDNYPELLKSDSPLFNDSFFKADISLLRQLADDLHITYEVPPIPVETYTTTTSIDSDTTIATIDSDSATFATVATIGSDSVTFTTSTILDSDSTTAFATIESSEVM